MSNFFETEQDSSLQEGVIGCIVGAMYADGEVTDEDIDNSVKAYFGRDIFKGHDHVEIMKFQMGLWHGLQDKDLYLRSCAIKVSDEWKGAVFAICCDLIFKDRVIASGERLFLKRLREHLGLEDSESEKILDVIQLLYKGKM